ncbi:VOC family protein [Streptomyces sp. NPDC014983]|uniref:VOC family protein n=1 Tax=Streptomyces sp. NPDC014983 TaxID=3364933 RepID=UPI0036F65E37
MSHDSGTGLQEPTRDLSGRPCAWADGIAARTLFVEDLAASKRLYLDVFDAPNLFEDEQSVVLKPGARSSTCCRPHTFPHSSNRRPRPRQAGVRLLFTVEADDVDARCAQLTATGVELVNEPMNRPWDPHTASFPDLNGYMGEIAQAR